MWKDKYKVIKIVPGVIVMPGFGHVDLSNDKLPLDFIEKLHDAGCPYLQKLEPVVQRIPKPAPPEAPPPRTIVTHKKKK